MDKLLERFREIAEEAVRLDEELTVLMEVEPFDQAAFDAAEERASALATEKDELELRLAKFEARQLKLAEVRKFAERQENREETFPKVNQNKDLGDIYDLSDVRGIGAEQAAELRGRALKAVENTSNWEFDSNDVSAKADRSKDRITWLLEHRDGPNATIAKLVLATNSPVYKSAWIKAVTDRKEMLTSKEKEVLQRAMSLTDGSGGFAVPMPIDPTLIQLGDGAEAGIRQFARVEPIAVDVWRGLATTQLTASWDAEAAEVSDDATTLTQPTVTVHKAAEFVPASIEIAQDYPNLVGDLGRVFADGKARLESAAFATGSGSGQPFGIVTALDGTGNEITSATTDVFAIADVYSTFETLGPRYRAAGVGSQAWCSNIAILNDIRQFGTANNYHGFTVDLTAGNVPAILGRPWFEMSDMDGSITALSDNNVLVFGDFTNYLIVDRVGFSVEYVPHLFHTTTNRPSGSRGWYAYWRTGADSINDDAFILLNVT